MPVWVKSHWPKYVEGCERVGRPVNPADWRVARSIFVADDDEKARAYVTAPNSPYRLYYHNLVTKLKVAGRAEAFKEDRAMPDEAVTVDYVMDKLVIWGSPRKVADDLLAFREQVGDFGTLLYAGKDWLDRDLGRRSMVLMAEKVLPALNDAIAAR
jgi:alkanesulfonate monooxygenase SsuD/methylene tetrahydromethanopterin reductase-like flavin-dependent oxidoreductase (luciferase family)